MTTANKTLDARGLLCPMPIVLASKAMAPLERGQVLEILATDRGSLSDVPAWAHDTGGEVLSSQDNGDHLAFLVRKT